MTGGDSIVSFGSLAAWNRGSALISCAIRRRWMSVTLFALLFLVVGGGAAMQLPRSYVAEAKVLVKKNYVMSALADPKRAVPPGAETPIQSAQALALSRQSLEGIIGAVKLLERWDRERPPLMRLKDRVMGWIAGPGQDADKMEALTDLLSKRLSVSVQEDVVTVRASWTDAKTVRDVVDAAVAAFLETRRKLDVQSIADTYNVLKRAADLERAQVDAQLEAVIAAQQAAKRLHSAGMRSVALTEPAPPAKDDGLGELRSRILEARTKRAVLDKTYQDRVLDLEARLALGRASQTERHPDIVAMRQALELVRVEPVELVQARAEEQRLVADYVGRGGRLDQLAKVELVSDPNPAQKARQAQTEEDARKAAGRDEDDEPTAFARALFKGSLETYQELLERLRNVQVELKTAEAAFGYRYSITSPARVPRTPTSPNVPLIIIGALLAGVIAGVARAVFKQLQDSSLLTAAALAAHLTTPTPSVGPS